MAQDTDIYANLIATADKAKQHNPGINSAIFDDIVKAYKQETPQLRTDLQLAQATKKAEADLQKMEAERRRNEPRSRYAKNDKPTYPPIDTPEQIEKRHYLNIEHSILSTYGEEGRAALKAFNTEIQPSGVAGVLSGIGKLFYDEGKGGPNMGGIIGAASGVLLGLGLTSGGGGAASWLHILAIGVAALVGAWVGNQASDYISGAMKPSPTPAPGMAKTPPAPAQAQNQAISAEAAAKAKETAQNTPLSPTPQGVSPQNPSNLSANPTPASQPAASQPVRP